MTEERDPFGGKSYAEQATQSEEEKRPAEQKLASYRIGESLIDRIDTTHDRYNVTKTDFVKALLTYALNELDRGNWELPTKTKMETVDLDEL